MHRKHSQCFGDRPEIRSLDSLFYEGGGPPTSSGPSKAVDWIRWTRAMICISVGSRAVVMGGGHCRGVAQLLLKCWLQVSVQKTGLSGQLLDPARLSNVIRRGRYTAEIFPTAY